MTVKHTVSTDALDTLGSIIDEHAGRDAIHIAVEPVVAAARLKPGQDVGKVEGGFATAKVNVGIVDPFLKSDVMPGERFWLLVYPRQITSLHHVWSHPAFDAPRPVPSVETPVDVSRKWIEGFAERIDQTYNRVMDAANDYLHDETYTYDNSERYKDHWDEFPEFWKHYEVVTGITPNTTDAFFTCSC